MISDFFFDMPYRSRLSFEFQGQQKVVFSRGKVLAKNTLARNKTVINKVRERGRFFAKLVTTLQRR